MKRFTAALALLAALPAQAADLGPICPDRPGKGTSPCTLAAEHAQVELGLFDESFQRRSGVTTDTGNAGALLVKYGINDRIDVEAGMALYQFQRVHDAAGTVNTSGVGDLFLRAKYNPLSSDGPFALVIGPYLKLPTARGGLGNGAVEGGLVAPMSYDLGSNWSLAMTPEADALLNASGNGHHVNLVDVVGIGRGIGNVTLGAEVWSAQNLDPAGTVSEYSFDLDAAWLIGNDTQIDGGANMGLNRATPDLEIYFGVSERF
jgi:Putative MetA-pathway of phenol degradation